MYSGLCKCVCSGRKWGVNMNSGRWFLCAFSLCSLLHLEWLKVTNNFSLRLFPFSASSAGQLFETSVFNFKLGAILAHALSIFFLSLIFFLIWKLSCHRQPVLRAITVILKPETIVSCGHTSLTQQLHSARLLQLCLQTANGGPCSWARCTQLLWCSHIDGLHIFQCPIGCPAMAACPEWSGHLTNTAAGCENSVRVLVGL